MDCSAKCEMPGQVLLRSAPSPVCAELCRTLSSPGEYCRSLTEIQILAAADVVCDLWMVKL